MNIRKTQFWKYGRNIYFTSKIFFDTYIKSLFTDSFSQYGEDKIINRLLGNKKNGFYIDIGANHPDRFSNTKKFYLKGWRGINIEPNPVSFNKFSKRLHDMNLNIGIGTTSQGLDFYCFYEDTLSTFSEKSKDEYIGHGYKLIDILKVEVQSLEKIFQNYVQDKTVDFISIDVEGFEMEVLKSNNWDIYKPTLIILESNGSSMNPNIVYEHIDFLRPFGYKLEYFNGLNSFFRLSNEK